MARIDYEKAIQVLKNEIACVNRDGCDRECCARCDLAMETADVLAALNLAIECIHKCGAKMDEDVSA